MKYCKYLDHGRWRNAGCTPGRFMCHAFYKGRCGYGANCRYSHGQLSCAEPQGNPPELGSMASDSVGIRHGNAVWNEFWAHLQYANTLAMFD